MSEHHGSYYIPDPSPWPLIASIGLFFSAIGAASWMHHEWYAQYVFGLGALIIVFTMFGWFGAVVKENQKGLYDAQVDRSFRWGMGWFIFSEVCFFGAFFGALFYARLLSIPELSGELSPITHILLWPDFQAAWPLLNNPDNTKFVGADAPMATWGLPALNTLILLTSGVTITWAHWALKLNRQKQLVLGLALTVLLGFIFLICQAYEYHEAMTELNLNLNSGIYGTTFFMLTGFHGAHVTIGAVMLFVILIRAIKGHFSAHNHFAFEAAAWYWHFVDVVWLILFVFVYWL